MCPHALSLKAMEERHVPLEKWLGHVADCLDCLDPLMNDEDEKCPEGEALYGEIEWT